jgi:three-Cys-motif partner protein
MQSNEDGPLFDDGLISPEVGAWTEEKHRLVSLYATLFSSGMKGKWPSRTYLDLYAGAGRSRIRGTAKFIFGSPLLALKLKDPFNKCVFCEEDPEKLQALKERVKQIGTDANVSFISCDCNRRTSEIRSEIPRNSLILCFADPFDIGLQFATIRALSRNTHIDFLILLALGMDANRNYENYVREDADKVDKFLGSKSWRARWAAAQWDAMKFTRFLANEFTSSMASLGYIPPPHYKMKEVRSYERNAPLYRLALFSRNPLAYKFWDEVLKYGTDQRMLFD